MKKKIKKQDRLIVHTEAGRLFLRLKSKGVTDEEKKELTDLLEKFLQKE